MEISGKKLGGAILLSMFLAVGLFVAGQSTADTSGDGDTTEVQDPEGIFEQVGIAQADLEEPLKGANDFATVTVDDTANDAGELTNASYEWMVANGTSLSFEEASAVIYHEVDDGSMSEVEYELQQGADHSDIRSIQGATLYNYESVEEQDEVPETGMASLTVDSDDMTAEGEVTSLQEGSYALVVDYKFSDTAAVPGTAGNSLELNTLHAEGDTDGDVDTITSLPVQVTAE